MVGESNGLNGTLKAGYYMSKLSTPIHGMLCIQNTVIAKLVGIGVEDKQ